MHRKSQFHTNIQITQATGQNNPNPSPINKAFSWFKTITPWASMNSFLYRCNWATTRALLANNDAQRDLIACSPRGAQGVKVMASTGLSAISPVVVIHSRAFFRTAGMLCRYSGVAMITASALAISLRSNITSSAIPAPSLCGVYSGKSHSPSITIKSNKCENSVEIHLKSLVLALSGLAEPDNATIVGILRW